MTNYKGDNTGAFNNSFITITLNNPQSYVISKARFVVGCLEKDFNNPTFPLTINFTSEETANFNFKNTGYLIVWDSQGRQKQCDGYINFEFKNGVIEVNG